MKLKLAVMTWLIALCQPLLAQPNESVYQVEMIIFERVQRNTSVDMEQWPKNVDLNYPKNWIRLLDPSEVERIHNLPDLEHQSQLTLSDDFLRTIGQEAAANEAERAADDKTATGSTNESSPSTEPDQTKSTYYQFLPPQQKTLLNSKKALDRAGNLRTLFHEAWLQPMLSSELAPALIIHAGNTFGEHNELEGYVTLSLSRYLHSKFTCRH